MVARVSLVLAGVLAVAVPARAQRVEASVNIGYSASEGISSDDRPLLGQVYDTLALDSGASFNFTAGAFFTETLAGEFLFGRQNSRLQADGSGGALPISELSVYNYMFNLVWSAGTPETRVRPYFFGGVGVSSYSFGANLLTGSTGDIPGDTRFSTDWGGGVKFYFTPRIGAKVGFRWTPTYIKSDPAGIWCDPFYGCWALSNAEYSHQFETAGGLTFRF